MKYKFTFKIGSSYGSVSCYSNDVIIDIVNKIAVYYDKDNYRVRYLKNITRVETIIKEERDD